jgi:peroxiredoxin family protein
MFACEMPRDVMGIEDSEPHDEIESGGVASFLAEALESRATPFD